MFSLTTGLGRTRYFTAGVTLFAVKIAIDAALATLRRLRDAGLSPWLALLFFAPFANIMFFGFCALVPGADTEIQPGDRGAAGPVWS